MSLRLSEAIRLGAMMKPQSYDDKTDGHSCALQAASDAIGVDNWLFLIDHYTFLKEIILDCPACYEEPRVFLETAIWHLNDDHRWPREAIADWVKQIEPTEQEHEAIELEESCQQK